jgi:hypothetical protein
MHANRRRRPFVLAAVGLMVTLPAVAFVAAPAGAQTTTTASPGANLAGISASATASAIQVQPLTPGFVGAGNVAVGDLIEADAPYASTTSSTGPTNAGTATPVYPGPTASELGTVFQTFAPIPSSMANLMNDPVLAQSTYPPQINTKSSASYAPPGGSVTGVGTASTTSTAAGSTATAALNDTSLLGTGSTILNIPVPGGLLGPLVQHLHLGGPLLDIASSSATTQSIVGASSVTDTAHSDVGRISLLFGAIQIAGVSSDASAMSNGTTASETTSTKVGAVTVLGHSASIGPNGIQVDTKGLGAVAVSSVNAVLAALKQANLSVTTLQPTEQSQGNAASVSSGVVDIAFFDSNIPNPQGQVPFHALGLNFDLGLSQASADATSLPPFTTPPGLSSSSGSTGSGGGLPVSTPSSPGSPGTPSAYVPGTPGQVETVGGTPQSLGSSAGPGPALAAPSGSSTFGFNPLGFMGLPVRISWVVLAFILSLMAAGPLLAYANWQLLRGRSP